MRRLLTALALGLASAALSACGGGSDPLAPTPPDPHLVSHALPTGEVVSALFRLHMNKATGDIEALPVVRGGGTLEQGGIYSLDLQAFQSDRTFRIVAVDNLGDRLRVRFSHSHPLQAPDPSRPASASNRADLGYTGRLVILADLKADQVAGHIAYGDVVASTGAVLDPDGYVNPAGLLADGAYRANTFPYVLLADEAKDNRVDISNGGLMRGSYRPEAGWERDSLRYGWTGYDYVHAGQTITNSFEITLNALQAMSFEVNLAVLVKYTEPKGEPGRKWRLPPHNPVKHQFAYRLPHGALDCSVVEVAQDPFLFVDTVGGTRQVPVKVRDWDAQATEDPAGLSRESHVLAVTPGASGPPTVEIELLGAPGPSLAPAPIEGNGEPGTELQYSVPFTRTAAMGNSHRTALLRVTDPEIPNGSFTGVFQAGLDPTTLAPDAQRALRPVTYQALTVVFPGTATGEAFGTTIDITPGNYSPLVPLTAGTPDASDDRLGLVYTNMSNGAVLARSRIALPRSAGDWQLFPIAGAGHRLERPTLQEYNGALVAFWLDRTIGRTVVAHSLTPTPQSPTDWRLVEIGPAVPATHRLAIPRDNVLQGRLGVLLFGVGSSYLITANSTAPWGSGDWTTAEYTGSVPGPSPADPLPYPHGFQRLLAINYGEQSVDIVYEKVGSTMPMFARSLHVPPASSDDWFVDFMIWGTSTSRPFTDLVRVGDHTEVIYNGTRKVVTDVIHPTPYDWTMVALNTPTPAPEPGADLAYQGLLALPDGCRVLSAWDPLDRLLKVRPLDSGCSTSLPITWTVDHAGTVGFAESSLAYIQNRLVVAYRGAGGRLWIGLQP